MKQIKRIEIREIPTGCTDPYEHGYIKEPAGGILAIAESLNECIDQLNEINKLLEEMTN